MQDQVDEQTFPFAQAKVRQPDTALLRFKAAKEPEVREDGGMSAMREWRRPGRGESS